MEVLRGEHAWLEHGIVSSVQSSKAGTPPQAGTPGPKGGRWERRSEVHS
jgi:hypothetical protein